MFGCKGVDRGTPECLDIFCSEAGGFLFPSFLQSWRFHISILELDSEETVLVTDMMLNAEEWSKAVVWLSLLW